MSDVAVITVVMHLEKLSVSHVYTVVGGEESQTQEDTHLILEYEVNDVCGNFMAPRANRSASVDLQMTH